MYIVNLVIDIVLCVISRFEKVDELSHVKASADFLAEASTDGLKLSYRAKEEIEAEWIKLFASQKLFLVEQIESIFLLNSTFYTPENEKQTDYFIRNKFWGLLNAYIPYTDDSSDDEFFQMPRLRYYYVKYSQNKVCIIAASLADGHLNFIRIYSPKHICLSCFSERMLMYNKETGFVSL